MVVTESIDEKTLPVDIAYPLKVWSHDGKLLVMKNFNDSSFIPKRVLICQGIVPFGIVNENVERIQPSWQKYVL